MGFNKVLASLSVVLGSDTKRFEKGMKKGKSELQMFAEKAKKMTGIAVAGFTTVSTAALVAANNAAEFADKIDKAAISSGLSRERLQGLSYVADQAGVDFETLSSGIAKLNRTMGDAAYGNKRQVEAFEKMGLSIYDASGQMKTMEQMFPEVVSALNSMENETERNALAMDLMGRSATQIIPRLAALGDEGIAALMTKAEDLGMVMGDDMVAEFVKFKDEMSTVKQQFAAMSRNGILPFAQAMNETFIPAISDALKRLNEIKQNKQRIKALNDERETVYTLTSELINTNTPLARRNELYKSLQEIHPVIVEGIKTESVDTGLLVENLQKYNSELVKRMTLANIDADKQKILADQAGKNAKLLIAQGVAISRLNKSQVFFTDKNVMTDKAEAAFDKLRQMIFNVANEPIDNGALNELYAEIASETGQPIDQLRTYLNAALADVSNFGRAYNREIEKNKNALEELAEAQRILNEQINSALLVSGNNGNGSGGGPTDPKPDKIEIAPANVSVPGSRPLYNPMEGINLPGGELIKFQAQMTETQAKVLEFSETVQSAFVDMAVGLGESIGNILSGQAEFGSLFDNIMEGFGKFAQDMGKLIIAYGFSMVSFQGAFSNPYAAIAAGTALVAIGTMVRNAAQSPDVSGGGTASAASSYSSYSAQRPTEQTIKLVWERAGKDLVAMINLENNAQQVVTGR